MANQFEAVVTAVVWADVRTAMMILAAATVWEAVLMTDMETGVVGLAVLVAAAVLTVVRAVVVRAVAAAVVAAGETVVKLAVLVVMIGAGMAVIQVTLILIESQWTATHMVVQDLMSAILISCDFMLFGLVWLSLTVSWMVELDGW